MVAMSVNEGYDPFDLTDMTEEEFEQLESAGEAVDVLPGPAPTMTLTGAAGPVHGAHLDYFVASSTAGVQVFDVQVVQVTRMALAGATKI